MSLVPLGKSLPSPFTFPDGLSKTILLSEILTGDNNSAAFTFPRDMLYLVPTSAITTAVMAATTRAASRPISDRVFENAGANPNGDGRVQGVANAPDSDRSDLCIVAGYPDRRPADSCRTRHAGGPPAIDGELIG